jgi:hypothetical protein
MRWQRFGQTWCLCMPRKSNNSQPVQNQLITSCTHYPITSITSTTSLKDGSVTNEPVRTNSYTKILAARISQHLTKVED